MKVILAFEHIRRLPGAHSQVITALGEQLVQRGHDVTILCDTVNDPEMHPDLRFIARRTFQVGASHRPAMLHAWARTTLDHIEHDVAISFHAAIPGDVLFPTFGLNLRPGNRFLPRIAQPVDPRRLLARSIARRGLAHQRVQVIGAMSEKMADDLAGVHPTVARRIRMVPGASPIVADQQPEKRSAARDQIRRFLSISSENVVFLWAGKRPNLKGVRNILSAFAGMPDNVRGRTTLLMACEDTWSVHDRAVDLGCTAQVRVLGRTAHMSDLLAAADVGVHVPEKSSWGRFAWECLASGLPVVARSGAAGLERMRAPDGRLAGIIVARHKTDELTAALSKMVDSPARHSATRTAQTIAPDMQFDRFVDRIDSLIEELQSTIHAKRTQTLSRAS